MPQGTGIDLVDVTRMKRAIAVRGFIEKNYSQEERKRCFGTPERYYSTLFALKEAYLKAVGKGLFNISMKEMSFILRGGQALAEHDKAAIAAYSCDRRWAVASVIRPCTPDA